MSHEMEGLFTLLSCLVPSISGHIHNDPIDNILVQKYLSSEALLTAPDMTFHGTGCQSSGVGLF